MKTKLTILGLALLALFGCGVSDGGESPPNSQSIKAKYRGLTYVEADTSSGPIPCIIWNGHKAGGLSCDWSNNE